jgi:hypothetical protein
LNDASESPRNPLPEGTHAIRLHAVWQRSEFDERGNETLAKKVSFPDSIPIGSGTSLVIYERRFNAPTGIEAGDRVLLESAILSAADSVTLNEHELLNIERFSGGPEPAVDVKSLLVAYNHLVIRVSASKIAFVQARMIRLLIVPSACPPS